MILKCNSGQETITNENVNKNYTKNAFWKCFLLSSNAVINTATGRTVEANSFFQWCYMVVKWSLLEGRTQITRENKVHRKTHGPKRDAVCNKWF